MDVEVRLMAKELWRGKKYNEAIIYIISQQHNSLTITNFCWCGKKNAASTYLNESCKDFFRLM